MEQLTFIDGMKRERTIRLGEIVSTTWGYDQTQYEFYQIVKIKGKSVYFAELEKETVELDNRAMTSKVVPIVNKLGEIRRKLLSNFFYWTWDGLPKTETHYA